MLAVELSRRLVANNRVGEIFDVEAGLGGVEMENLSPLEGRYESQVAPLRPYLSEEAFYRYRVRVEIEWVIHQTRHPQLSHAPRLTATKEEQIRRIESSLEYGALREIEAQVQHDGKAIEMYLAERLTQIGLKELAPSIHFGCTSEDISSVAYSLMLKGALAKVLLPEVARLSDDLRDIAFGYRDVVILGLTHGQPAVPTTLGKELAVTVSRIDRQVAALAKAEYFAKFSGAVGSYNAHVLAYPDVDWEETCRDFVESLGLQHSTLTTQVDSRDSLAEIMHIIARLNAILVDFVRDIWLYGAVGYLRFLRDSGTVGSSTMPQKANPIDFENAEANARISLTLLSHLSEALVISRLQRDLSDSSAARNIAVALGHFLVAVLAIRRGLPKLKLNTAHLDVHLVDRWEVMAEAAQTLLRKAGVQGAFELVSEVEQADNLNRESLLRLLDGAKPEDRERFASIQPQDYLGLSSELVDHILRDQG